MKEFIVLNILSLWLKYANNADKFLLNTAVKLLPLLNTHLLQSITFFGNGYAVVAVVIPMFYLMLLFHSQNKYLSTTILVEMYTLTFFNAIVIQVLKYVVRTERPNVGLYFPGQYNVIGFSADGFSFPSGHSSMFLTPFLLWKNGMKCVHQNNVTSGWYLLFGMIAALIPFSRVVVAAHWPSDVLFSTSLSFITCFTFLAY